MNFEEILAIGTGNLPTLRDFQSQASSFPILPERFQAHPNILPNFAFLQDAKIRWNEIACFFLFECTGIRTYYELSSIWCHSLDSCPIQ
jgi:hypothetical protein